MIYRISNNVLAIVIAVFATGTLADQTTRTFSLSPKIFLAVWLLLLVSSAFAWRRFSVFRTTNTAQPLTDVTGKTRLYVAIGAIFAGVVAFILNSLKHGSAADLLTTCATILIVVGSAVAISIALRGPLVPTNHSSSWTQHLNGLTLAACAAASAAFAAITYRPNSDDHYYLNLSTYIYEHGVIPTRDTVLSNQIYTGYARGSSWEVMWGAFGSLVHVAPATLLYVIWVPFAAALGVSALAVLFDAFGVRHLKTALITSSAFLIFDGASGYTFGNYQATRIWQGKCFYLAVLIPLLIAFAIKLLTNFTIRDAAILSAITVASVGATTSTFVTATPILAAGLLIALFTRKTYSVIALGIPILYSLCEALLFRSARNSEVSSLGYQIAGIGTQVKTVMVATKLHPPTAYDLLTAIAHPGWHAGLFAVAIVLGWLGIRVQAGRLLIAMCLGMVGIIFLPGMHQFILNATSSNPIGWRFMWMVPIPALIGVGGSTLMGGIANPNADSSQGKILAGAWLALVVLLPMTIGTPTWKVAPGEINQAFLSKPTHLRVFKGSTETAEILKKIAHREDIVLASNGISSSLAATTTKYYTVAPRAAYALNALVRFPEAQPLARVELGQWATNASTSGVSDETLAKDLSLVHVDIVCLTPDEQAHYIGLMTSLGYTNAVKKKFPSSSSFMWCGRTTKYQ